MKSSVTPGTFDYLKRDPGIIDQIYLVGEAMVRIVPFFAPRRTGHYVRSVYLNRVGGADPHVQVGANDFKAWWIEFGAYNRPHPFAARATLRSAASALGMRIVSVKKGKRYGSGF